MSILADATAECPTCGTPAAFEFPASVNADRRPDLREAILDGSLQAESCRACGESLMFEPDMTYLDVGRRQWILARPSDERGAWEVAEQEAWAVFNSSFESPFARSLAANLVPRLVFGWPALAEKIRCQALGFEDTALEATKLTVLAESKAGMLDPDLDLRLTGENDHSLLLNWIDPVSGAVSAQLQVPRQVYVLIKGGGDAWAPLRARLAGPLYVDIGRVLHSQAPA